MFKAKGPFSELFELLRPPSLKGAPSLAKRRGLARLQPRLLSIFRGMSWSQRLLALVQQVEKSAFGVGFDGASRQKETVQERSWASWLGS